MTTILEGIEQVTVATDRLEASVLRHSGTGDQADTRPIVLVHEVVFEDAGHSPHIEDPERFREVLLRHVSAAEAA